MARFAYSDTNKRYYTWDYYLKRTFGGKVAKVALDGGFTCPNLDGACGVGGCTYCLNGSASSAPGAPSEQYAAGREQMLHKWPRLKGFLPYLQAHTNTYAPVERLKAVYEPLLSLPGALGLVIATRADALPEETLEYLEALSHRTWLMVELGLQTTFDETARRINRGHDMECFLQGYRALQKRGIRTCIHLINGLPGETEEMMRQNARRVAELHPDSVKLHLLHIMRGTEMERELAAGAVRPMELQEYVGVVCDQLELLPPETVIQRLTGDGVREQLIAPLWSLKKVCVLNEIDKEMARRDSVQGRMWTNHG